LKKAFDSIDQNVMMRKLEFCGICGLPLNLFKSYFSNRKQTVRTDNFTSNEIETSLGPILFSLYVNFDGKVICFTDDTVLLFNDNSIDKLYNKANSCLELVKQWPDN